MSPKRQADKAAAQTVLPVALPLLATVLDLPVGTNVVSATVEGGTLLVTLDGIDWSSVRGWKPKRGATTPTQITAEYEVDAHGRRSLNTLVVAEDSAGIVDATESGPDPVPDPPATVPPEEKE